RLFHSQNKNDPESVVQQIVSTASSRKSIAGEFAGSGRVVAHLGTAGHNDSAAYSSRQAKCIRGRRATIALKPFPAEPDCLSEAHQKLLRQRSVFRNGSHLSDRDFVRPC